MQARLTGFWRLAAFPLFALACANETPAPQQPGPCPPGSARTEAACVEVAGRGSVPPQPAKTVARVAPSPAHAVVAGPEATRLDSGQARAGEALLAEWATSQVGDGVPSGELVGGQFREGESVVTSVPARPGGCYSVVALGLPPVTRIEVALRAREVPEFGGMVQNPKSAPPKVVLGGSVNCVGWTGRGPGTMELVLTVKAGEGVAVARVYEKR